MHWKEEYNFTIADIINFSGCKLYNRYAIIRVIKLKSRYLPSSVKSNPVCETETEM